MLQHGGGAAWVYKRSVSEYLQGDWKDVGGQGHDLHLFD